MCLLRPLIHPGFAILGFLLIGLMVMDWQTQRLPDAFTLTGIAIGFALACVQAFFCAGQGDIVLNPTISFGFQPGELCRAGQRLSYRPRRWSGPHRGDRGAALLLLAVRWIYKAVRKRDGMGLGDVKLLAMIAAFLGFGEALLALFAGVLAASVYGIVLMARGGPAARPSSRSAASSPPEGSSRRSSGRESSSGTSGCCGERAIGRAFRGAEKLRFA